MWVGLLGAAEVWFGDAPVDLGARKQRALLAALGLSRGRPVAVDTVIDLLWSDSPPAGARATLQGYVKGLRHALEPDRAARMASQVLVTRSPGYALEVEPEVVDVARFEDAIRAAHQALAPITSTPVAALAAQRRPDAIGVRSAVESIDAALGLWRGTPFLELEDAPAAIAERARLEELRLLGLETRAAAAIALGEHAVLVGELEHLTGAHPLRERLWGLRALSLALSGRQGDALGVLQHVRQVLVDELGIEPGAELRSLQAAILRQDLTVAPPPAQFPSAANETTNGPPTKRGGLAAPAAAMPWPMVGRTSELAALVAQLEVADDGRPCFAALVGEPGIGKSRLASELAQVALERGASVLVGRCSQDEGAPPLWPWRSVMAGLGEELAGEQAAADDGARFRSWERIAQQLLQASIDQTLLVVLDDLHWADVSSLRVLGLLLEMADRGRCLVVCTWRDQPTPTGALATVAEGMARRHCLRLHLGGLQTEDVAEVVAAVATARPSDADAKALRDRTDGNPFFLVEYARMGEASSIKALLEEPHPPGAVTDVLARRLERLPAPTQRLMRTASVIGRHLGLSTLAAAFGDSEDVVLDLLEPALDAGLIREDGAERFRFAHALVRDVLYGSIAATRRARLHATVAEILDSRGARESEAAQHWFRAGPAHAGRAWRTATTAAASARQLFAYDEAAELLESALAAQEDDTESTLVDRYEVLLALAEVRQRAGRLLELRTVVHRGIEAADALTDIDRLARIAVMPSTGALWQAMQHGDVDPVVTAALRRALDCLPMGDGALRCRVLLSLSGELYYGVSALEREALAEQAVAMARRIGDRALLMIACQNASISTWRAATAHQRLDLAQESARLAEELGDESGLVVSLTVVTIVSAELGKIDLMEETAARTRERAEKLRHLYALLVIDNLEVPWKAMRGEFEQVEAIVAHIRGLGERTALSQYNDALAGALLVPLLWQRRYDEAMAMMSQMQGDLALPMTASYLAFLTRSGQVEVARTYLRDHPIDLEPDTWLSPLTWGLAAEVALAVGDPDLGARAYERIAGLTGRVCLAGSGAAMGPMDAFVALAAASTGELALASKHADQAEALCRTWRIPLAAQWLRDQRDAWGF